MGEIKSGGTFGNLISFIQELTEAAHSCPKISVVVSIPESDTEVVDDFGSRVLKQVEKVVGRVEFVWTPVTPDEGYEIVRRRLFKSCSDDRAREKVCTAFFNMYVANENDFTHESRQSNYREKLLACYPIHPQLFSCLYERWTLLEKFQKTRGVLRLMANVIYHLWSSNDANALIMPGNIPINFSPVRDELAKLLSGNWDAIINAEVDGEHSKPYQSDLQNPRFGRLSASRKIARTIFMGTAPGSRQGEVRGIDEKEIHLGTIQPHELENISAYNDAPAKLKSNLYYLYSQETRLWFGANPTLRKFVDDKRGQFSDDDIEYEIEKRIETWKVRGQFKAVYACPKNSADVPDEQTARLIILSPKYDGQKNITAIDAAKNFLESRGSVPRRWKNMLMFMAADAEKLHGLKNVVRDFLAWRSVNEEARHLNLDSLQLEDAKNNLKLATENFAMKTSQAYCKIFAPERSDDGDLNRPLEVKEIDCTKEDNIFAASEKFLADEMLLGSLGCETLRGLLDKFIWRDKDSVKINQLWEYFATYYYLPRLVEENVLIAAVRKGVEKQTFTVAEDFQDGKFLELKFGDVSKVFISPENFLVKADVAQDQLKIKPIVGGPTTTTTIEIEPIEIPPPPPLPKHFSMDVELDNDRCKKNFNDCIEEIASPLMNLPDVKTSIRLVLEISVPEGIPSETQEQVTANCRDMRIGMEHFHFES